ncbi:hypothetical protein PoB_005502700 [Plakobranchus ocellatus]|uniref:Uncharacterized protein n=1 Tax=Plakobranchus ocellatus TaxID=259542 RepID=A0AAV4CAX4_9GAST|nr:hypothetical protein PoB_005502700 [Plakobranchus ocellatus]
MTQPRLGSELTTFRSGPQESTRVPPERTIFTLQKKKIITRASARSFNSGLLLPVIVSRIVVGRSGTALQDQECELEEVSANVRLFLRVGVALSLVAAEVLLSQVVAAVALSLIVTCVELSLIAIASYVAALLGTAGVV